MAHKFQDDDLDLDTEVVIVNGQRLTNTDADAWADELSSRERSNANLIPGRKSLSGQGEGKSPVVNVRVSNETRADLDEMGAETGQRVSKIAREALDDTVSYYVCWEQRFDGAHWEVVRINKALTLDEAKKSFEDFRDTARALGARVLQIRRGRDQVMQEESLAR